MQGKSRDADIPEKISVEIDNKLRKKFPKKNHGGTPPGRHFWLKLREIPEKNQEESPKEWAKKSREESLKEYQEKSREKAIKDFLKDISEGIEGKTLKKPPECMGRKPMQIDKNIPGVINEPCRNPGRNLRKNPGKIYDGIFGIVRERAHKESMKKFGGKSWEEFPEESLDEHLKESGKCLGMKEYRGESLKECLKISLAKP